MKNVRLDMDYLRKLKAATNDAITRAHRQRRKIGGAVNWADLHCICAELCIDQEGEQIYRVSIEEAAPGVGSNAFALFVQHDLAKHGFEDIQVETEW